MKSVKLVLAAAAMVAALPAQAALIGDFRLDGNLVNQVGGPLTLTNNNGGVLGATGISFGQGQGPDITGFSSPAAFSIETAFRFDTVSGYRRVMDFLQGSSDSGLYVLNGQLNFYPVSTGGIFAANTLNTVVFTRSSAGVGVGWVNGVPVISLSNLSLTALTTTLRLFRDDGVVGGENSAGFVDYIRVYDTALTATEVDNLMPPGSVGGVPEPSTWAMMLLGFGALGAMLRRRRTAVKALFA